MVLLILVVRILSYRRSENKETQERSVQSSNCSGSLISFLFSFNLMRSFDDLGIFLRSNANFKALQTNIRVYSNLKLFPFEVFCFKKKFTPPFYGWGSTASRLQPLRGDSLLFTIHLRMIFYFSRKIHKISPNDSVQYLSDL